MKQASFTGTITGTDGRHLRNMRATNALLGTGLVLAMAVLLSGVRLHPSTVQFGSVQIGGDPMVRTVKLTNRTRSEFRPARVEILGPSAMDFQVDPGKCSAVRSGESCLLTVKFQPRFSGTRVAQLAVASREGASLHAELWGDARASTVLQQTPVRPPFGAGVIPTASARRELGEENPPQNTASTEAIPQLAPSPTPAAPSQPSPPSPQGPNVRAGDVPPYTPPETPPDDYVPPPHPAPISPAIRVQPTELDFTHARRRAVAVFNDGNAPLSIRTNIRGQDPSRFDTDDRNCAGGISPKQSCSIVVYYKPAPAEAAPRYVASLDILHNVPSVAPQDVALRWTRMATPRPHLVVNPTILDFSSFYASPRQMREASARQPQLSFTILNDGAVTLEQLNAHGENLGPFRCTNNCRRLAPGQQCTENVTFSPTQRANYNSRLYVLEGASSLATVSLQANMPLPSPSPPSAGTSSGATGVMVEPQGQPSTSTGGRSPGLTGKYSGIANYGKVRQVSPASSPSGGIQRNNSVVKYGSAQGTAPVATPPAAVSSGTGAQRRPGTYGVQRPTPTPTPPVIR